MTAFVLMTTMLAAAPTTIAVTPAATCSPRSVLERELRRAPVRFVDDDAELTLRLEPERGGHRLRVTDLEGVTAIDRLLPTSSCDEAAVAAALIVDRALRDIVVRLPALDGGARRREASTKTAGPATLVEPPKPGSPVADGGATEPPAPPRPTVGASRETPSDAAKTPTTDRGATEVARNADPARGTPRVTPGARPSVAPATERPTTTRNAASPERREPPTRGRDATPETPPIPPPLSASSTGVGPNAPTPPPTSALPTPPLASPPTRVGPDAATPPIPPPPTSAVPTPSAPPAPPLIPAAAPAITEETSGLIPAPSAVIVSGAREAAPPVEQRLSSGLRFELTAGGGFSTPTPSTLSLLLTLDAAFRLRGPWRLGVLGAFSFGGSTPVIDEQGRERGALSTQALFVLPHALACLDTPIELCAGVRGGLRLAAGTAGGPFLFQTRTVFAPAPSLGPGVRAAFAIGPVVIALDLTGLVNLATPALTIEGLATRVETPRFELLVQLSAGGRSR